MEAQGSPRNVFAVRLILGLAQGLALYLLYSALDQRSWPATIPLLFAPLAVVALFIPLLLLQGLGNLRTATILIWTAAAAVIVSGLAFYDVWHAWPAPANSFTPPFSGKLLFVCALFLFVAHALVSCGDADRRIVARYTTLFDLAWKLGVQIAIAACFVASFWLILGLGVALFHMIKLTGFARFIGHPWVWIPFTTLATAVSIHITDTRANLVRGVRTLALTLLGWLLPVITAIAFAFLISLMVTGLQPLWETRYAAFLLLAAAAVLVIHINAAYQDGAALPHHVLRVAGTLASVLLVFIVAIAAYALWLRVNQYGWTVERITTAGCVVVAAMFAVGYLTAAVLPSPWLKLIERWNVYGTFAFLIVLLALHTPIADPMRISVNDQMARLNAGVTKPDKFDFRYLRWEGGRFGRAALQDLGGSKNPRLAHAAKAALSDSLVGPEPQTIVPGDLVKLIRVHPSGAKLPDSFLRQNWTGADKGSLQPCLSGQHHSDWACDAFIRDVDGGAEVILIQTANGQNGWLYLSIYRQTNGRWELSGTFAQSNGWLCKGDREALLAGKFEMLVPVQSDLEVQGHRLVLQPGAQERPCQ